MVVHGTYDFIAIYVIAMVIAAWYNAGAAVAQTASAPVQNFAKLLQ